MFQFLSRVKNQQSQLEELLGKHAALHSRVEILEKRLVNYYKNRWDVLDSVADYLVNAELPGDYAEFGVFKGTTFGYAANLFELLFPAMRFLAFDSFEGMPQPKGIDLEQDGFSSGFFAGQYATPAEEFRKNVLVAAPKLSEDRLLITKGWFDKSLTRQAAEGMSLKKLACVWVDCDFYESTVPVLDFITPYLSVGTVILFDDWRCYRNLKTHGEQRACQEWLQKTPGLELNEFISFGFHGMSFTVAALPDRK